MKVDRLVGSPFRDYLLPVLLLFAVIGMPAGLATYGVWARPAFFRFFLQPVLLSWAAVIAGPTLWPSGRRWFVP